MATPISSRLKVLAIFVVVALVCVREVNAQSGRGWRRLRPNFYATSCPDAERIIRQSTEKAFQQDPSFPGAILRMFFHDCMVRGCDASVLLDNDNSEKLGAPNANSLRGFEALDEAKANLEYICPGVVSCADVLAYAARDSIELASPGTKVRNWTGGRRDGVVSVSAETLTELPGPFSNFTTLERAFAKKGLNQIDLVVLSGAHSVGKARCGIILSRLYNFKGTGKADPSMNPAYVAKLKQKCPPNAPGNRIDMEEKTPNGLDTNYYVDVERGRGLFESDNALRTTPAGRWLVRANKNKRVFDAAFVLAMKKVGNIDVLVGNQGQIRTVCNAVN
ncbi:hypothetical protein Mapa_007185 [Marchantia paleacea]|nr:hypothetical protein Mapa_007185 [Marchantia paleacea]